MKTNLVLIAAISLCAMSCTKNNEQPISEGTQEQPTLTFNEGRNDYQILVEGITREFIVHVPRKYTGSEPVPLLFMLHGSSGTGEKFWNITSWKEKAEEENFIAVFPTALNYPIAENNGHLSTKWSSAGLAEEIIENTPIIDDIPFFRALISTLENSYNLNKQKYYISGFSNGGGFVKSRILAEMSDVFAAVSSAGGLGLPITFSPVQPIYPPLYNIVGSLDSKVLVKMGNLEELPFYGEELMNNPHISHSLQNITDILKMSSTYSEYSAMPAYNQLIFNDSNTGQNTEYVLQIINDMGHNYPNGKNNDYGLDAVDFLWPWFMQFEKSLE